ncbi:DUF1993 family protein, partial [Pseudomonas syringae group genomosp. 7]|uniref:DUF1993 family protein n=1 Tax=Pseudomonas syringae group genomosp. 7 TaxID=251699 RepID=UPI00376F5B4B
MSLCAASIPVFQQIINDLTHVQTKPEASATEKKIHPPPLLKARLFPENLPYTPQDKIAVDLANGASAR